MAFINSCKTTTASNTRLGCSPFNLPAIYHIFLALCLKLRDNVVVYLQMHYILHGIYSGNKEILFKSLNRTISSIAIHMTFLN